MNNVFKRKIDKSYRPPPFFCRNKILLFRWGESVKTELENLERLIDSDLNSAGIGAPPPPPFFVNWKNKVIFSKKGRGGKNALTKIEGLIDYEIKTN